MEGTVTACGNIFPDIFLHRTYYEPGYAEYLSNYYITRDFFGACPSGDINFRLNSYHGAYYAVYASEVKFSVEQDLNFVDDISLSGYSMPNTVCYPGESFLKFGVTVNVLFDDWPYPCEDFYGYIKAFKGEEHISTTCGLISPEYFTTTPDQSYYEISPTFDYEVFNLNWKASVNHGPDREAKPISTTIRLYHGCRADEIIYTPPSGDTLFCSNDPADFLELTADPMPFLADQTRIKYKWIITPLTPPGQGSFPNGNELRSRTNHFRADYPGNVQIQYKIKDISSGYESAPSDPITLHLAPRIEITTPNAADDTATFNTDNPGVLIVGAGAKVTPAIFTGDLVWNITTIDGSTLQILPSQAPDTANFKFTTLPAYHTEFAKKKWVYASLSAWNVKDSAQVKIFFSKFPLNHTGPAYSQHEPNWYYFWKQTNAGVLLPQDYGDPRCTPNKAGFYERREKKFHICDAADGSGSRPCAGDILEGIDLFAITERHEGQHYTDWWTFWPAPNGYIQSQDMDPPVLPQWPWNGDYVPDRLEGTTQYPNFSPDFKDSDGDGYYDFDDLGYDAECTWPKGEADTADWANPGHQY